MAKRSSPTRSTAERPPLPPWHPSRLAQRSAFPAVLQAVALGVLLFMIVAGWGLHGVEGVSVDGALLYTNVATFGFWVVWFMALVALLPLAGRTWCTVCPVGWCNDLAARFGLKRPFPRALQNFLPMAVLLLGLTLLAEVFGLNRYPDATAALLLAVLAASALSGLVFRGRVFCRYLCPVGGMVGLYSRLAPPEVGSRNPEICRRCESKACYHGSERRYRLTLPGTSRVFTLRRPGCPAFIYPPEAASNANCLMCTQCFKNCPYDNLRWGVRRPLAGLWLARMRDRSEALLVMVLTGVVFYRLARFWGALREAVEWPATAVAAAFPDIGPVAFRALKFGAGFLLWPLVFFLLLGAAAKLAAETSIAPADERPEALAHDVSAGEADARFAEEERRWAGKRHTLWGYLAVYCYAFIPLVAGAYAAFAVVKLNEKLGYLPLVLADPAGVRTYLAINQLLLVPAPESLVPLAWARWAVLLAVAGGGALSVWSVGRIGAAVYGRGARAARRAGWVFRAGLLGLSALMAFCAKTWLFRG